MKKDKIKELEKDGFVKNMVGALKEASSFAKEVVYIRCHAIIFKDEHGQVIYTFKKKKEADEFFKTLTTPPRDNGKKTK